MTATLAPPPAVPANALLAPQVQAPGGDTSGAIVPPVQVVLGTVSTIPYPTSNVGPVPIPWQWVLIINSSPFTLAVTSGLARTQIPAFSMDLVQINPSPTIPVRVMPQQGSGTPAIGSDSTVYATYYASRPAGSFPAAIGAGAVVLQSSSELASASGNLNHNTGQLFGPFSVAGFGSLRLIAAETSGTSTGLQFSVIWTSNIAFGATRQFAVSGGGSVAMTLPNITDTVELFIQNNDPANVSSYTFALYGAVQESNVFVDNNSGLLAAATAAVANGNSATHFFGPYAGPVFLDATSTKTGGIGWSVDLNADLSASGAFTLPIAQFASTTAAEFHANPILIPVPMEIVLTNATGVATTFTYSVIADSWRG